MSNPGETDSEGLRTRELSSLMLVYFVSVIFLPQAAQALPYAQNNVYTIFVLPEQNELMCINIYSDVVRRISIRTRPSAVALYENRAIVVSEQGVFITIVDLSKSELQKRSVYLPRNDLLKPSSSLDAKTSTPADIIICGDMAYIKRPSANFYYCFNPKTRKFTSNTVTFGECPRLFSSTDPLTKAPFLYGTSTNQLLIYHTTSHVTKSFNLPECIHLCVCHENKFFVTYTRFWRSQHKLELYEVEFSADGQSTQLHKRQSKDFDHSFTNITTDGKHLYVYSRNQQELSSLDHNLSKNSHERYIKGEPKHLFFKDGAIYAIHNSRIDVYQPGLYLEETQEIPLKNPITHLVISKFFFYDSSGNQLGKKILDHHFIEAKIRDGFLGIFLSTNFWTFLAEPDCSSQLDYETLTSDGMDALIKTCSLSQVIIVDVAHYQTSRCYKTAYNSFLNALVSCNPYACALAAFIYFKHPDLELSIGFDYYNLADKKTFTNLCLQFQG